MTMATGGQRRELEEKVTALVAAQFGGDYRAAFDHYDADRDGSISDAELKTLLKDAGVGSGLTRWAWAEGVMDEADRDGNRSISWAEFETLKGGTG
jgi:Ca2+-binding EF-hand superfamily protein